MTHCDRLLAALADREWHDHHERRVGDLYLYRLAPAGVLPEPPTPAVFHAHGNDADTCAVPRRGGGSGSTQVRADVEQLVLGAA